MNQSEDKLSALLKQWQDIEPKGDFETNVWRQIRTADSWHPERVSLMEAIGRLLWEPAWSVAAALGLAVLVGVWGGVGSVPYKVDASQSELQFLAPGTLAGSYLQMTGTESR
jgi:hypothetical protein